MPTQSTDTFQERRRHVRVDDDIVLIWREVAPDEIPEAIDQEAIPIDFPLFTQIKLLSLETGELLQRIGQDQPLLAEYLKIMELKIDILSQALDSKQDKLPGNLPTRYVNLSAAGLAFITDVEFQQGTLLELKMILPPSLAHIIAYGRVVDSMPNDEYEPDSYSMGVDFIRLREQDRDVLIRHVARRKALFRESPRSH